MITGITTATGAEIGPVPLPNLNSVTLAKSLHNVLIEHLHDLQLGQRKQHHLQCRSYIYE